MDAGTVFKWNNFTDRKYGGELKPRWFIYLGDTGPIIDPGFAYLATTTTNLKAFERGGDREYHTTCSFSPHNSCFETDCILDIDEEPYDVLLSRILNNKDIEVKGRITDEQMRMIWNRIIRSGEYSRRILLDIHDSFNRINITGLKKP